MKEQVVRVQAFAEPLQAALERYLIRRGVQLWDPSKGDDFDLLIISSSACSPGLCGEFIRSGIAVIVLAAITREDQLRQYTEVGARYLPMSVGDDLLEAVLAAGDTRPS